MKLATRLGAGFGLLLALLALVGFFALGAMNQLSDLNRKLYEHPFAVRSAALAIDGSVIRIHRTMKDVVLARNQADFAAAVGLVNDLEKQIVAEFKTIERRFLGERAMYLQAEALFKQWRPIRQEVIDLVRAGNYAQAAAITKGKGNAHMLLIISALNDLEAFAEHMAAKFHTNSQGARDRAFTLMYVIIALAIGLGVIFTILITRSITGPAREIAQVSEAIADGDLNRRITYEGSDEIGQMARSLRRMLAGVIGEGQSIKNGIMIPLWTADNDLTITFLNPAAASIAQAVTGLETQEIVGRKKVGQVLRDQDGIVAELAAQSLADGGQKEAEASFKIGDSMLILHESTSRLWDLNGDPLGVMGVGVDISKRKLAEQEKTNLEEQLRQSQKMEALGTLAGGVAHDFNNILSAIIGYSELTLEELPEDSPLRHNLKQVLTSGFRARDLVAQLLAVSRKQVLELGTFGLNQVVERDQALLERIIGEDIDLEVVLQPDTGLVLADFHQLGQVLLNLVANARDALPQGGKVTIETGNVLLDEHYAANHAEATPGPHVMLAVSDNGPGMDSETQEHMFDPFFTTKGIGKGTGLGLAIVYGIIKQSGGNIYVYSELDQGTTFKVYLPRAPGETGGFVEPAEAAVMIGGSETVLVVEDEALVREFFCRALARLGYQILAADGGEQALGIMAQADREVDMLLTDVIMPKISGKDLYLRLLPDRPGLRVLYISGYTDNVIAHHGVLERGVNFLQKPVSIAALAKKMRQVLDAPA
jgi:PAS domain S-box-containing protein